MAHVGNMKKSGIWVCILLLHPRKYSVSQILSVTSASPMPFVPFERECANVELTHDEFPPSGRSPRICTWRPGRPLIPPAFSLRL